MRENGQPVVTTCRLLRRAAASRTNFGAVLVIDASDSMQRRADPGRAGAPPGRSPRQRNANQKLGVVTFNGSASVALPLHDRRGDDRRCAREAAAARATGRTSTTRSREAVGAAEATPRSRAGSIVLLSDGADIEQQAEPGGRARGRPRSRSPGLHGRASSRGSFDSARSPHLADGTATADYAQAKLDADADSAIYAALGAQLGQRVPGPLPVARAAEARRSRSRSRVAGVAAGRHATTRRPRSPAPSRVPAPGTRRASGLVRLTHGRSSASCCALLIGLGAVALLARRPRAETARRRGWTASSRRRARREAPEAASAAAPVAARRGRPLARERRWWPRFKEDARDRPDRAARDPARRRSPCSRTVVADGLLLGASPAAPRRPWSRSRAARRPRRDRAPGRAQRELFAEQLAGQPPGDRVGAARRPQLRRRACGRGRRRRRAGEERVPARGRRRAARRAARGGARRGRRRMDNRRPRAGRRSSARSSARPAATRPRCSIASSRRSASATELRPHRAHADRAGAAVALGRHRSCRSGCWSRSR